MFKNNRQVWKWLIVTNIQAYYTTILITTAKVFYFAVCYAEYAEAFTAKADN
jgi:hypothetical protein